MGKKVEKKGMEIKTKKETDIRTEKQKGRERRRKSIWGKRRGKLRQRERRRVRKQKYSTLPLRYTFKIYSPCKMY